MGDVDDADGVDELQRRTLTRAAARSARRALPQAARRRAQTSIDGSLVALVAAEDPGAIATYAATDGEVDPLGAAATLVELGWRHHLPVLRPAVRDPGADRTADGAGRGTPDMAFAAWSPGAPCRPNRYGIDEPADPERMVSAADLDVVVVPCVAVDPAGHRLGFGAGFYDRALAGAPDVLVVGVAFEVQLVERIEPHDLDVGLDVVITEERVLDCRRR